MSGSRAALKALPILCAACWLAAPAIAGVYPDTVGDQAGSGDTEVDISGVEVTNTASTISFKINLVGDISTANFGNYQIGFDTGPG